MQDILLMQLSDNMKKTCIIIGAGDFYENSLTPQNSYIIAADGGFSYLSEMGIIPDMVIGDFDSLGKIPDHENIIKLPVKKDDTDIMSAVKFALEKDFDEIHIYGATGGNRFDHTLANIQTLQFIAKNGATGFIIDKDFIMMSFSEKTVSFDESFKGTISLFAFSEKAEGVSIKGLLYEGENLSLSPDFPLGVSNSFKGETAEISAKNGILTAIWYENRFPDIK